MKKMRIEKSLLFQDPVDKVLTLKVTEGLTYKQEEDGIRATGPLFIRGVYENDAQHKFQEILEMDVLAPREKLSKENFFLEVGEFQGTPSDEGIDVVITINIHGLLEDTAEQATSTEASMKQIVEAASETDNSVAESLPVQNDEDRKDEATDPAAIEDLFEDANNVYTSYRIVVAKENDTYETIAERYQVEEAELRSTNANKDIHSKTLVILPYAGQIKAE